MPLSKDVPHETQPTTTGCEAVGFSFRMSNIDEFVFQWWSQQCQWMGMRSWTKISTPLEKSKSMSEDIFKWQSRSKIYETVWNSDILCWYIHRMAKQCYERGYKFVGDSFLTLVWRLIRACAITAFELVNRWIQHPIAELLSVSVARFVTRHRRCLCLGWGWVRNSFRLVGFRLKEGDLDQIRSARGRRTRIQSSFRTVLFRW